MSDITKIELKDEIEVLEQRIVYLNQSISDIQTAFEEKLQEVKTCEEEYIRQNTKFESEIEAKQGTLNGLNKTIGILKEDKAKLVLDISELNQKTDSSSKFLNELNETLEKGQKELFELQKEKELAKIIPEIKIKADLVQEIKGLNIEVSNLENSLVKLTKNNTETENSLLTLRPSLETAQIEQKKLQESLAQLLKQVKNEGESLTETRNKHAKEKDTLLNENVSLKTQNTELQKENLQIEQDNKLKFKDIQAKEKTLQTREESLIFQTNTLLIREKKVKQKEEAVGLGLEINQ